MRSTRGSVQALLDKVEGTEDISQEIMLIIDQWESTVKEARRCMDIEGLDQLYKLGEAYEILEHLENAMF